MHSSPRFIRSRSCAFLPKIYISLDPPLSVYTRMYDRRVATATATLFFFFFIFSPLSRTLSPARVPIHRGLFLSFFPRARSRFHISFHRLGRILQISSLPFSSGFLSPSYLLVLALPDAYPDPPSLRARFRRFLSALPILLFTAATFIYHSVVRDDYVVG